MSMLSDDGWDDVAPSKNPVVIEKVSGDGIERAVAQVQVPEDTRAANVVEEKLDNASADAINNNMAQKEQFVQQESTRVEQPAQETAAPTTFVVRQISNTNNTPKVDNHVILPEQQTMDEPAVSKQNQTAPLMTGDREATLAYFAKLSKIYADFGQNLANLHKEFAERLGGY